MLSLGVSPSVPSPGPGLWEDLGAALEDLESTKHSKQRPQVSGTFLIKQQGQRPVWGRVTTRWGTAALMSPRIRHVGNGIIKKLKKDSLNLYKNVKSAMCSPGEKLI